MLNEPPYEFAPRDRDSLVNVKALQLEHAKSRVWTDNAIAVVVPQVLLLLLDAAKLKLQE